jgi:spermidine/putrescine transport system permease protein
MSEAAHPALRAHLWLVYLFLYGPILVLVFLSFNKSGLPTTWTGFSTDWYGKLWQNGPVLAALWNSVLVAAVTTVLSTVIGTLLAMGLEEKRRPAALEAIVAAPMIVPDIVLAVALLSFYSMLGFTLGLWSIIASHAVFNIAFVVAVVRTRFRNFDHAIIEASIDLGASELRTFFKVTLPVILPGVIAAALISFTLSFDEFIIAYFTAGAGSSSTTFPMKVYAMIRFGVTPEINAVATIVTGVTFLLVFIAQRLQGQELQGSNLPGRAVTQ